MDFLSENLKNYLNFLKVRIFPIPTRTENKRNKLGRLEKYSVAIQNMCMWTLIGFAIKIFPLIIKSGTMVFEKSRRTWNTGSETYLLVFCIFKNKRFNFGIKRHVKRVSFDKKGASIFTGSWVAKSQSAFTCSKLTTETLEEGVKYA